MPSLFHRSTSLFASLPGVVPVNNRHLPPPASCLGLRIGRALQGRHLAWPGSCVGGRNARDLQCRAGGTGREGAGMGYWLVKTEPGEWGWEHQERNGGVSQWDGVRNAQAQSNLRGMRHGDHAFFYHSGKAPAVVGVVEVIRAAYPDTSDATGKHCMVDVRALASFPNPVPLSVIKADAAMRDWILLRQSRLSVMPVSPSVWARVCELGELSPPPCSTTNDDNTPQDGAPQPKRSRKKTKKQEAEDSSVAQEEPNKRPRRLPSKTKNGTSPILQEEDQSTESHLVKTYQRGTRRKVDVAEVAVIAPKVSKRQKTRGFTHWCTGTTVDGCILQTNRQSRTSYPHVSCPHYPQM